MGANQPPQNKKRVTSAKSLANLRPNPQHMRHRGGSQPREYATQPELDFLNCVLDGEGVENRGIPADSTGEG
jgi:hypothetical protein